MTEIAIKVGRQARVWAEFAWPANGSRLLLILVLASVAVLSPELRAIVFQSISDAYLQVTVFVAATLGLVYTFERAFGFDIAKVMARSKHLQSPISAVLGALPGCGGAIIVVTNYTRGYVSFGGVVAVLIATMGDAAFLLIAREPATGLMMMATGLVVGTLSGWLVDYFHEPGFMRPKTSTDPGCASEDGAANGASGSGSDGSLFHFTANAWFMLVVPAAFIGLGVAMQLDTDALFGPLSNIQPTHWLGVIGGALCLLMWAWSSRENAHIDIPAEEVERVDIVKRVIKDTNFVTSWVVVGFLTFELAVHFAGTGINDWFKVWAPFVPLVAILVGFIPGCGPQIITTTLYLSGTIPLSAQLGNAISNDGDALFPALALAPRAAIMATAYSAVPALIIAYSYYFMFE